MITRQKYMENHSKQFNEMIIKQAHRAYYDQFVTPEVIQLVSENIGVDKIKSSDDEYFNDIPLIQWDSLHYCGLPRITKAMREEAGEGNSLSTTICIAKAAARKIKNASNN